MIRMILAALVGAGIFAVALANQKPTPRIDDLQKKRISLLSERVAEMKKLLDSAHVDFHMYSRSEIDLIRAKLDYSTTSDEKRLNLGELLEKYDLLIEEAALRMEEPPGRESELARANLLWLQSERVRIELQIAALDE